jgi:hypothetical protein
MSTGIKGVRATHEDYDEYRPVWDKCSDLIEGGTRVLHEKRETYLPRYNEEDDDSYNARLNRTTLYNAAFRTVIGCRGLLQRKPTVVTLPPSVKPMMDDVTLSGMSLSILIGEVIEEVLTTGRVGLFVNFPDASSAGTLADALKLNLRPSIHKIEARAITNWATRRVENETVLSLVVIQEEHQVPIDEFTSSEETQYRVLDLFDTLDASGTPVTIYRVRMMAYDKDSDVDVTLSETLPLMGGKPLTRIPLTFISPDCVGPDVDSPPFEDLVELCLTHYDITSSYLSGVYWSGLPQIVVSGYETKPGEKLRVSPSSAWCFPAVGTKATVIEVGSQGFPALEKALDRLEKQMVVTGTRALQVQTAGGQESTSTAELHLSSENSVLASMGQAISTGLTQALKTFVAWTGNDSDTTSVILPKTFFDEPLTPEARLSIVKSWQAGAISDEARFNLLKSGGDFAPDYTFEQEQAAIKASAPKIVPAKPIPDQPLADQMNPNVGAP